MEVLRLPEDHARWHALWEGSPLRDPYLHPTYASVFCSNGQTPICLVYRSEHGAVMHSLLERPIPDSAKVDCIDPYGYGGPSPLAEPPSPQAWEQLSVGYWGAFREWAHEAGVVTLFGRPSLLPRLRITWPDGVLAQVGEHVVRTTTSPPDVLWMDARAKVRKNVKRARRSGLSVTVDATGEHLDAFVQIYESTLDRREARDSYYHGRDSFERLLREAPACCRFFHTWQGGRIVSTELVLVGTRQAYSFLGGTLADAFADRPNDLLKWEILEWCHQHGIEHFVMGGGPSPGDGVFEYKLAFAPSGAVPFYVANWVLDREAEQELVDGRARRAPGWAPAAGWFPRYRA